MKKTVGALVVAGALMTGAFAGASSNTFTEFVNQATDSLFVKVASWAGYTVDSNGDQKVTAVANHTNSEFDRGANEVAGHFNSKVAEGSTAVNNEYNRLVAEITSATNAEVVDAKGRINAKVDEEKNEALADMLQKAKDTAQAKIDAGNKAVPSAPAYE